MLLHECSLGLAQLVLSNRSKASSKSERLHKCTDEGISLINTVADWQNDSIGACTKEWKPIDMVLFAVILDLERSRQAHWWKH